MIATPVFLASRKLWKDRQKLKITQTCQLESRPSPQYPKSGRSLLVPAPVRRLCLLTQALSKRLNTRHPKRRKVKLDSAIFINGEGHTLSECKALSDKTLEERSDFILKSGLCFKCLSENCRAVSCKVHIVCSICGDKRHIALLHSDKNVKAAESVGSKCTAICSGEGYGCRNVAKFNKVDTFNKSTIYIQ